MVVYRQCEGLRGSAKMNCLINAILSDYFSGRIDRNTAVARLRYLVALNATQNWVSQDEAYRLVASAIQRIGGKLGRRMQRELRKLHAVAY